MGKIQHADLPEQYLHEPKGAKTASAGTVYVANGSGSGAFGKLPVSSLDFTKDEVIKVSTTEIPTPVSENGTGLTSTADGTMSDVNYVTQVLVATIQEINKNFKELFTIYSRDVQIHSAVKADVEALTSKLNALIDELAGVGLITTNE